MITAAFRRFYSWHVCLSIGRARIAVVVPDTLAGVIAPAIACTMGALFIIGIFDISLFHLILCSIAFVLLSPLFLWQLVIVSAGGTRVFRVLLLIPYWVAVIPSGAAVELHVADGEKDPSGVAYNQRGGEVQLGNAWNARALFELLRKCEECVRSSTSLERTHEG